MIIQRYPSETDDSSVPLYSTGTNNLPAVYPQMYHFYFRCLEKRLCLTDLLTLIHHCFLWGNVVSRMEWTGLFNNFNKQFKLLPENISTNFSSIWKFFILLNRYLYGCYILHLNSILFSSFKLVDHPHRDKHVQEVNEVIKLVNVPVKNLAHVFATSSV